MPDYDLPEGFELETPAPGERPGEQGYRMGDATDALFGFLQGWADPVEGLGQMIEHLTGQRIAPEAIRTRLRDFRDRARGTVAGQAGELGGNIFNPAWLIPGAAAGRVGGAVLSRLPGAARAAQSGLARLAGRAAPGAIAGATAPVSPTADEGEYWRTKANQALWGGALGASLPALAAQLQRATGYVPHFTPSGWWHHPGAAIAATFAPVIGAGGRQAGRLPPGAVPRAVGEAVGQNPADQGFVSRAGAAELEDDGGGRRQPLRVTVGPRPRDEDTSP